MRYSVEAVRIGLSLVFFALMVVCQYGCSSTSETTDTSSPLPEVMPEAIWKYITEDNPYTTWSTFPSNRIPDSAKWKDDYILSFLEGNVFKIYINDIGLKALDKKPRNMPYGTIIIAEVYNTVGSEEKREIGSCWLITGFYKVEGSTARDNDWVTFAYNSDGTLFQAPYGSAFGTKTHCYACHEASENDYIWIDSPKYDSEHSQVPPLTFEPRQ